MTAPVAVNIPTLNGPADLLNHLGTRTVQSFLGVDFDESELASVTG